MTDLDALKAKIEDSGMTIESIAERANIKRYTLDRRLKGEGEFTASHSNGGMYEQIRRNNYLCNPALPNRAHLCWAHGSL